MSNDEQNMANLAKGLRQLRKEVAELKGRLSAISEYLSFNSFSSTGKKDVQGAEAERPASNEDGRGSLGVGGERQN